MTMGCAAPQPPRRARSALQLQRRQPAVERRVIHQLDMRALRHHAAFVDDDDAVGVLHCGEAVGDDEVVRAGRRRLGGRAFDGRR